MNAPERVCVVGLGYIGLPTAVVLARAGMQVIGVDVRQDAVDKINAGKAHIVEPDLDGLLHLVVREGKLRATTEPEPADVFVIAVPTPFKGDHEPDLSYVESAARAIAPFLKPGNLVVLESTVPPGATEQMVQWILEERPDLKAPGAWDSSFYAAHGPERVLPGRIIVELVQNDRVVGGVTEESSAVAKRFYETFVRGECVVTDARTAELAKLTENAFRDVNIAFANELSIIAGRLGVDPFELISLANRHPRVNILQPGPGVGGHCIAVDPWFIVHADPEQSRFIRAARETNLAKTRWVIDRVVEAVEAAGDDAGIACFGLAYKADVDDLRESPALEIAVELARRFPGRVTAV
ncbi:MAG TPA: UDP-N-acetyl-D-mannosamine dehydrogenase, partial [Longimicrobiales bacterium]|nr:UDP-N-acetyl-D-mannosamine dehydrogenase [Longimicrobiales bacterium]